MQRSREEHFNLRQWLKRKLKNRHKLGKFVEPKETGVLGLWWTRDSVISIGEQGKAELGQAGIRQL